MYPSLVMKTPVPCQILTLDSWTFC